MESFPRSLVPNRRPEVVSERHEGAPLTHFIKIGQVQRADRNGGTVLLLVRLFVPNSTTASRAPPVVSLKSPLRGDQSFGLPVGRDLAWFSLGGFENRDFWPHDQNCV
jgi:hypothetical protein